MSRGLGLVLVSTIHTYMYISMFQIANGFSTHLAIINWYGCQLIAGS